MTIFRCKMCGGDLEVSENATFCKCEFCGTRQTLPLFRDETLTLRFNRANELRNQCEFDKASGIYETIIQEYPQEAEAYWGLILCKYGIEYVEDTETHEHVLTCHSASYEAVAADEDYLNTLKYADTVRKELYKAEAHKIDAIQRDIIALAQQEEPYDVFLCYKETDGDTRTQDSVIAYEIYYQLVKENLKVFYAPVTLEQKLGSEYEPVIFSALNTAKVMLVIGTKPEYFKSVWVKTEWSRFLKLMRKDHTRILIPCYREMDPYKLPQEFAHLQAQDMGKIGFITDLVHGIRKVTAKDVPPPITTTVQIHSTISRELLKRGFLALNEREWDEADSFFEQALNHDAECGEAYWCKFLVSQKCTDSAPLVEKLLSDAIKFTHNLDFKNDLDSKTLKLSTHSVSIPVDSVHIQTMEERYSIPGFYDAQDIRSAYEYNKKTFISKVHHLKDMKQEIQNKVEKDRNFMRARKFAPKDLQTYMEQFLRDIESRINLLIEQEKQVDSLKTAELQQNYQEFLKQADKKVILHSQQILDQCETQYQHGLNAMKEKHFLEAKVIFNKLKSYKDSMQLADQCMSMDSKAVQHQTYIFIIIICALTALASIVTVVKGYWNSFFIPFAIILPCAIIFAYKKIIVHSRQYNKATTLMEKGYYEEAITLFKTIEKFKDSTIKIKECQKYELYYSAIDLMKNNNFKKAIEKFNLISGFRDSSSKIEECWKKIIPNARPGDHVFFGRYKQDNNRINHMLPIEWRVLAKEENRLLLLSEYGLDAKPFNKDQKSTNWENCTLRSWLNKEFYQNAFSAEEQKLITEMDVKAEKNLRCNTNPGNNTRDKIFLLSIREARTYFTDDKDRQCKITAAAKANNAHIDNGHGGTGWWWLRSPGDRSNKAANVYTDGFILTDGFDVSSNYGTIRPAFWLSSKTEKS